ncbi:sigma-70 family RNA polymerase sigma factor [uncultured Microscilla sp.]|uniref:RNA polymerase sigma factor n=1 Tax=uncultured Microscilla sp. TaxID=432653 RepID=UPI0026158483|nr:sigma-70 family RNA polymerase sigma factor [uncultured Microscilla sp.]
MEIKEFKIEVLSTKNKLFRFAFRLLRNHEEAEDTVQDVFLKLWDIRHKLDQYNSVEALAMTMIKNKCFDKLKAKRNQNVDIDQQAPIRSGVTAPDRKTELRDTSNLIQRVIDRLPEQQKMIIQMRDIEGMEFEEIAKVVQLSINNVRVNLSRARKKVRDVLTNTHNYGLTKN